MRCYAQSRSLLTFTLFPPQSINWLEGIVSLLVRLSRKFEQLKWHLQKQPLSTSTHFVCVFSHAFCMPPFSHVTAIFKLMHVKCVCVCVRCTWVCTFDFDTFCYHFLCDTLLFVWFQQNPLLFAYIRLGFGSNTLMHLSKCFPAKNRKENSQIRDLCNVDNVTSIFDVCHSGERCHHENCSIRFL